MVLVIIRKDLAEAGPKTLPTMLQYRTFVAENSLYNTPPTFGIYLMGEVFKWIQSQGGLAAMAEHNAGQGQAAVRLSSTRATSSAARSSRTAAL